MHGSTHASGPGVSLPRPCGSITHLAARLAFMAAALLFSLCLPGLARAQSGNISVAWPKYPPARTISTGGDVGNTTVVHIHFTPPPGAVWPPQVKECRIHEVAGHVPDAVITNVAMDTSASKVNECPQCYPTLTGAVYTWLWPGSGGQPAPTHNGQYTITATCHYGTYMPPTSHDVTLQSITVNLRDHIITPTQPQNPNPILWNPPDPVGSYTVPVEADIDQAYSTTNTPITLQIFDSTQSLVKTVALDRALPVGTTHLAYAWDGSQDPPLVGGAPIGVYLFKWTVGNAWYYDTDCDKSTFLTVYPTTSEPAAELEPGEPETCRIRYTLTSQQNRSASCGHIDLYDGNNNVIATRELSSSDLTPGEHEVTVLPGDVPAARDYKYFVFVDDSHGDLDKGHRQRWALQHNQPKAIEYHSGTNDPVGARLTRGSGYASIQIGPTTVYYQPYQSPAYVELHWDTTHFADNSLVNVVLSLYDGSTVWTDTQTGRMYNKAYDMGHPGMSMSSFIVPMVAGKLQPVNYTVHQDQSATKAMVLTAVKDHTVFYAYTHGDYGAFESSSGARIDATEVQLAEALKRPSDPRVAPLPSYTFVFIDACRSAMTSQLADAFRTTNQVDSAFLGWTTFVTDSREAFYFSSMVWTALASGVTVENARLAARRARPYYMDPVTNVRHLATSRVWGDPATKVHGVYGLKGGVLWHNP